MCLILSGGTAGFSQGTGSVNSLALPQLGDGAEMASATERRLGDRIARELYRDPDYLDDPVIQEYIQSIWRPLLAAARLRGDLPEGLDQSFAWEILLGKDRSVNAFALPGGYLGVHLGLVAVVTSKDELASVLAHELSHVTQRHIARAMSRQKDMAPWLMGAMVLGMLAASKDPGSASAMVVGGQAAAAQTQLNFSRDMEREADRIGFGVMTQAGFEPAGFVTMFQKLQQASRLNDAGGFPYLRSHPLTTERIADMQARVSPGGSAMPSTDMASDHALIAARARVLSNSGADALRGWANEIEPSSFNKLTLPQQLGTLYGAALAAARLRDFTGARALIDSLLKKAQGQSETLRLTHLLAAEVALLQGNAPLAQLHLKGLDARRRATQLLQSQAGILTGRAEEVSESLRVWVSDNPRDAQAWQLLATAYHAQGRVVAAIRSEAEANVATLDFPAALARLKAAQEASRRAPAAEHIDASIVDTRLRRIESTLREQALER